MGKAQTPFLEPFETDCDPCYAPDCPHTAQCIKLLQAENKRLGDAIQIARDFISGRKGVCNVGNALDTLEAIDQALQEKK